MDFRFQSPKTLIRSQAQVATSRNKDLVESQRCPIIEAEPRVTGGQTDYCHTDRHRTLAAAAVISAGPHFN